MIGYIIISVVLLIIILFVYREYKNEEKYQEERRQKRQGNKKKNKSSINKPAHRDEQTVPQKDLTEKKPEQESIPEPIVEVETPIVEKIDLPVANYPRFDHSRLLDMGLSQEDAKEFVQELIPQIETNIVLIQESLEISDFQSMERLTHSLKGSSTTVGTGGVADLLVDFNTYLKTGTEFTIAEAYLEHLKHYFEALKKQYS